MQFTVPSSLLIFLLLSANISFTCSMEITVFMGSKAGPSSSTISSLMRTRSISIAFTLKKLDERHNEATRETEILFNILNYFLIFKLTNFIS